MLFQLETLDDMKAAHDLLPALGDVHVSNLVWDPAKKKFARGVARDVARTYIALVSSESFAAPWQR